MEQSKTCSVDSLQYRYLQQQIKKMIKYDTMSTSCKNTLEKLSNDTVSEHRTYRLMIKLVSPIHLYVNRLE